MDKNFFLHAVPNFVLKGASLTTAMAEPLS
jgi:hypothetical protein